MVWLLDGFQDRQDREKGVLVLDQAHRDEGAGRAVERIRARRLM